MCNPKEEVHTVDIGTLLRPLPTRKAERRVWSIPLAEVWLPFFTATNVMGETNIPAEVLGAPLRLAKASDGTPRFSKTGRPVLRVVRELSDHIRIVRENFAEGLKHYAYEVQKADPEGYKAMVQAAQKAGEPLLRADQEALTQATETKEAVPA